VAEHLQIVVLGLSITSSWGNGHATTFRGLVKGLARRGHRVLFLERDMPWYADNRDLPEPPFGTTVLYRDLQELSDCWTRAVRQADLVIVGSYVPEGIDVASWVLRTATGVRAFYDIDTPVTLAKLAAGDFEYLTPELIPQFDLYLSFTGGPTLERLERCHGARRARPLYCSVDPDLYYPERRDRMFDLGYMGTYSTDRQKTVERLLLEPAQRWPRGRFIVAGPQFPPEIVWPRNVQRIEHLPPARHRRFYNECRFTLNVTRADMIRAGYAPSVRLFEAAACGTAIISDWWEGLDEFFLPDREIFVAESPEQSLALLGSVDEERVRRVALRARRRVLARHTADHRAEEVEKYVREVRTRNIRGRRSKPPAAVPA
jgi:spore maturation protein CgeB